MSGGWTSSSASRAAAPHDCGVVSWNGTMYINCIRSIQEPELELHFYWVLHRLGLPVKVESNQRAWIRERSVIHVLYPLRRGAV